MSGGDAGLAAGVSPRRGVSSAAGRAVPAGRAERAAVRDADALSRAIGGAAHRKRAPIAARRPRGDAGAPSAGRGGRGELRVGGGEKRGDDA